MDTATIEVYPVSDGGVTASDATVCYGDNSGVVSVSNTVGEVTKWQYSTNGGSTWTDIFTTDTFVTYNDLTLETEYRAVVQSGPCSADESAVTTISIQPLPTAVFTNAGPTTICAGDDVSLDITTTNTPSAWTLYYSVNGTPMTTSSSPITLDSVTVATTVELDSIVVTGGCSSTLLNGTHQIKVNELPVVSISSSSDTICNGSMGTFTVVVDNVKSGQGWTLVYDEGTSTGLTKTGIGSGSFTVNTGILSTGTTDITLQAILNSTTSCPGVVDTTISIVVSPTTVGGLTASDATVCYGDNNGTITLSGETGDVMNWEYSTDGGNTWTVTSNVGTTITYNNITETTMYRAYVVSGACSGAYSSVTTITVKELPEAIVNGAPEVCPNEPAVFTLAVTKVDPTEAWTVTYTENGTVKTISGVGPTTTQIVTAGYPESTGTIEISLSEIAATCIKDELFSVAMAIITPAPMASFNADNACQDSMVMFNNTSTISSGTIAAYKWYFGDGDSSQAVSPSHAYASAGTYTVTLIAYSENGCENMVTSDVTVFDAPVADFTFDNVCKNEEFSATDASTIASGTIVSRVWDFGDNTPVSTDLNPTHTYASSGNYFVTLTVTSDNGCMNEVSKEVTIYVLPDADFTADDVCEDAAMNFYNGSAISYGSMTYDWTFDNQGTSTDVNPAFTFTGNGTFSVKLVATSNNGCKDSVTNVVNVWPKPVAGFTVADVCIGEASEFVNTSTVTAGTIDEYFWTFGDATYSTGENPSHTYGAANESGYGVELRVVTDKGCADIVTGTAVVWPLPVVNITADRFSMCDGDSIELTADADQAVTTYRWNTEETTKSIQAKKNGWYTVTVVGDPAKGGCTASDSTFVTVWSNPVAYAGEDTVINLGSYANLEGSGGLDYTWTPITYLDNPGVYNPTASDVMEDIEYILTVTDENGCIDSDSVWVRVIDKFALTVYNVITPNADGDNDTWIIDNIAAYPEANVSIINRYGMEVYNATGYQNDWDGTYEGKDLPDGAYYYVITLPNRDDVVSYTGVINLLRSKK